MLKKRQNRVHHGIRLSNFVHQKVVNYVHLISIVQMVFMVLLIQSFQNKQEIDGFHLVINSTDKFNWVNGLVAIIQILVKDAFQIHLDAPGVLRMKNNTGVLDYAAHSVSPLID